MCVYTREVNESAREKERKATQPNTTLLFRCSDSLHCQNKISFHPPRSHFTFLLSARSYTRIHDPRGRSVVITWHTCVANSNFNLSLYAPPVIQRTHRNTTRFSHYAHTAGWINGQWFSCENSFARDVRRKRNEISDARRRSKTRRTRREITPRRTKIESYARIDAIV